MMSMEALASGAAGAAAGLAVQGAHDRVKKAIGAAPDPREEVREQYGEFLECLERLEKHLEYIAGAHKPDKFVQLILVLMPGNMIPWSTFKKNYTMLFLAASASVLFDVVGVGQVTLSLAAGWNIINLPEGTRVGLPSNASNNVNALFRASDVMFGNAV